MSLCRFRHIFGREREGIHSLRIMDIAVVDVVLTVLGAIAISYATGWDAWYVGAALFGLAIVLHRLFCVDTTVNKAIFGEVGGRNWE